MFKKCQLNFLTLRGIFRSCSRAGSYIPIVQIFTTTFLHSPLLHSPFLPLKISFLSYSVSNISTLKVLFWFVFKMDGPILWKVEVVVVMIR